MKLFGLEVGRARPKAAAPPPPGTGLVAYTPPSVTLDYGNVVQKAPVLAPTLVSPNGSWMTVFDFHTGAWQQDAALDVDTVLTFSAVFACMRLIASDIGKLDILLLEQRPVSVMGAPGFIWTESTSSAFSPVLRKPNYLQNRIKFYEHWILSKLQFGNTYVLKSRDGRGQVISMQVLDPNLVTVLIAEETGDVFYRLSPDPMLGFPENVTVPAREIIHDVHMTFEHPLIGVGPLGACALAAAQGLNIQRNSRRVFGNMSRPSGILTAPGPINKETAAELKASWEANYGGDNWGKTAVLGDALKYEPVAMTAEDAQLIEQLNWTAFDVCRAFGVPPYKIAVGPMPAYNNIEVLQQAYYNDTLQELIECIEILLDEGLEIPPYYWPQFNLDGLLRMDSMTRAKVNREKIAGGYYAPNEARYADNLPPVEGGDTPYLQQQNFALHALAKRDAKDDPFAAAGAGGRREGDQPGSKPEDDEAPPDGGDAPADDTEPADEPADKAALLARVRRRLAA